MNAPGEDVRAMIQKIDVDTVVFDFDGTLARLNINFTEMRNSVMRLIASYGAPAEDFAHLFALEMIDAGRRWISLHGTDGNDFFEKAGRLIRDIELAGARKGELVPGVREMLSSLKARGIKTAVVTRNCRDALVVLFPDLDSHVGAVVTRESTPKVKPEPDHLLIALGKISADPRTSRDGGRSSHGHRGREKAGDVHGWGPYRLLPARRPGRSGGRPCHRKRRLDYRLRLNRFQPALPTAIANNPVKMNRAPAGCLAEAATGMNMARRGARSAS